MEEKQEKDSADVGGTEIQTQQGEYHGEGKALIGKKVRKKDGKRQTPGDVEDYDPETKLYKVRFEADRVDEIKWEELKNYLPQQEIRLKRFSNNNFGFPWWQDFVRVSFLFLFFCFEFFRFPQKKKEAAAGSVEGAKPGIECAAKPDSNLEQKTESQMKDEKSMEEVVKTPARGDAEEATDISAKEEKTKQDDKPVENTVSSQEATVEGASLEKDLTVHQESRVEISTTTILEAAVASVAAECVAVASTEVVRAEIAKDDAKDEKHEQDERGAKTEKKVDEVAEVAETQEERGVQGSEAQEEKQAGIDINEGQHEGKAENGEPKETMVSERNDEEEGRGKETNDIEEQAKRDEDSEGSLDESDMERLTKKRKRKRKHVLTMQKWKGYKKKRKLAAEKKALDAKEKDEEDVNHIKRLVDEMEVIPRRESRTRKLTEVDEIQRKRQKIAQELKNKLKAATPIATTPLATKKNEQAEKQTVSGEEQAPQTEGKDAKSKSSEAISDAKPSPFDRGIKLRGRKLRKNFNGKVFRGEIADYDRRTRYYKIKYEDGDEEKLMWKDVGPMLVPFEELHSWDDPDSEPQIRILTSDDLLEPAADKKKSSKESKKPKLPSLKPLVVKKGRR